MIPGQSQQFFEAAAAQAGAAGYEITRSLRFNSADSAYLNRTPSSAGNRKTWTWSGWVKRGLLNGSTTYQQLFSAGTGNPPRDVFFFDTDVDDTLCFYSVGGFSSSGTLLFRTNAVFRDTSAWYHIVLAIDTTQATASNRVKLYVNGVLQTFSTANYPAQNSDGLINNNTDHAIGRDEGRNDQYLDAYLADVHLIDGQALAPTDFGEYDSNNVWQPIEYAGTYGTNGFRLSFSDNSTAAALGTDSSGNGNDWTVNNFSVANGTTSYIGSTSGSLYSGAWINAFDGIIPSGFKSGAPYNYNTTSTLTFGSALSGTIEVYGANGGSVTGGTAYIALSDGSQWDVANITASNAQWYSFGSKTNITSISLVSDNLSQGVFLSGVRVNGAVLVDKFFNSGNDSLVDSPTNGTQTDTGAGGEVVGNYCTMNPLDGWYKITTSNGNLEATGTSNRYGWRRGTLGATSGKFYWECEVNGQNAATVGVCEINAPTQVSIDDETIAAAYSNQAYCYTSGFQVYIDGSLVYTGSTVNNNDIIGVAVDLDNGKVWFSQNGVFQGSGTQNPASNAGGYSPTNLSSGTPYFQDGAGSQVPTGKFNFGQRPFAYTAPSGFKALCTKNLTNPTIADGSTAMDVITYSGNGTSLTVPNASSTPTSLKFDPGFVWIKQREIPKRDNNVYDIVRGATKLLSTNGTSSDSTTYDVYPGDGTEQTVSGLTQFNTNSKTFDVGSSNVANSNAVSYVAWAWDGGTSTVSNTDGSITSSVRANQTAGFSIVKYTGNSTAGATIGHGLNAAPEFALVKSIDDAYNWCVYAKAANSGNGQNGGFYLNLTNAWFSDSGFWNSTAASSTTLTLGSGFAVNENGDDYIAYCFAPVEGYSAFGSFASNGSADNVFIYLGFRARFFMYKRYDSTGSWVLVDTALNTYNLADTYLQPHRSAAEVTFGLFDILSNGIKIRISNFGDGFDYIYAAFAEHPFKTARAR